MALYGRHGEAPMPVLAASSASDCFNMTLESARIALKYMTPVLLLTDGYIGQATEPWKIPDISELPDLTPVFETNPESFAPYKRDPETLRRLWAIPGTQGLEHRIGGLEKQDITGEVSHEPSNHQRMVELRKEKIDRIAKDIPPIEVQGEKEGDLLLLSWGSTYGAAKTAFEDLRLKGEKLSFANLKYLHPFPENLGEILYNFKRILIPELNMGQLKTVIQSRYLIPVIGLNKVQGKPFKAVEIEEKIVELLKSKS
jgi:2-oxoglutarate ferredoxin oxidoreductase subunit alpha